MIVESGPRFAKVYGASRTRKKLLCSSILWSFSFALFKLNIFLTSPKSGANSTLYNIEVGWGGGGRIVTREVGRVEKNVYFLNILE